MRFLKLKNINKIINTPTNLIGIDVAPTGDKFLKATKAYGKDLQLTLIV